MIYSIYLYNLPNVFRHYDYMKACIYGQAVDARSCDMPGLVDHRYFYDEYDKTQETFIGRYSCGIARNAVAPLLLKSRLKFNDKDFLKALPDFIDNPSV